MPVEYKTTHAEGVYCDPDNYKLYPDRVFARVREVLLTRKPEEVDAATSSILRDAQFAVAWNNANAQAQEALSIEELLHPVVSESLRQKIGEFRDEIQRVADAWASVVGGIIKNGGVLRPEVNFDAARVRLPGYLDDDGLPIELWDALRARDSAAVCYLAVAIGADDGASPLLIAEYVERHCRHQRRWLDCLSWIYGLPSPAIVLDAERQNWGLIFAEWADAERGVKALLEHAAKHPDGFAVGDLMIPE